MHTQLDDLEKPGRWPVRTLLRELAYQRQFAGIPHTCYQRAYCQKIVKIVRQRLQAENV